MCDQMGRERFLGESHVMLEPMRLLRVPKRSFLAAHQCEVPGAEFKLRRLMHFECFFGGQKCGRIIRSDVSQWVTMERRFLKDTVSFVLDFGSCEG